MHIVRSHPSGEPVTGNALCGLPVDEFKHVPMRTDRFCQSCTLIDVGTVPL